MPTIQGILNSIHGSKLYSTFDMKSGFWQSLIHPDDREKTAFSVEGVGQFEFLRLPFGLMNASANFERLMDRVLLEFIGKSCYVYIDDIIVFSRDEESHTQDFREVLQALREAGLTVNPSKCQLL